ncbi:DUF4422 domain-containing protein [Streptococcus marimammalium]|uniref:DUF4422 domain-containing protein n=1 Tax=Streptococcus marimammalium TaxID=269666 RepID=UPI0003601C70|nr:DUF4422 domain-containing protein [Streptococcus marimammalium]
MDKVKIVIATHKKHPMPKDSDLYVPIHVGKQGKDSLGYQGDDTGDNVSQLNPYYSELTALYWAWKNLDYDYLGLVHYRRYFTLKKIKFSDNTDINSIILSHSDINNLLSKYDMILPKKQNYYIETLYSHYSNTFDKTHLDLSRQLISEFFPNYLNSFDKVMKQKSGHMFNMFIMKKEHIDNYLTWLFSILEKLMLTIDTTNMTFFEKRLFGRVSEILFNVWLDYHQISYKEVNVIYTSKVNYFKKAYGFLMAKFFKRKYKESF